MKMLKNGHEVDAFATSRIPIPSPRSTKKGDVLRCAARPLEPLVHDPPDHHHAEDGAVAAAVDGAEDREYKNRGFPFLLSKCVVIVDTRWLGNVNARRLADHHVDVGSRVGRRHSSWMSKKASVC